MKRTAIVALIAITISLSLTLECQVGATDAPLVPKQIAELLDGITSEDASTRMRAFKRALELVPEGIKHLIRLMPQLGQGRDAGVRFVLHGLAVYVTRPGMENMRRAFVKALCEELANDLPVWVKQFIIRQIQIAGRDESVPALTACLNDKALAESARQALLANPTMAATKALRKALVRTSGTLHIGIIHALGERRDVASVPALIAEAKSDNPKIRIAAMQALGKIGHIWAEPVIFAALTKGDKRERRSAMDSYLQLAEKLFMAKRRADALRIYIRALKVASSAHHRRAALLGIGRTGCAYAVAIVLPYLTDADASVRAAALECLARMPDPHATGAIVESMKRAAAPVRALLLRALSKRGDDKAMDAIKAASDDPNPEVRVVAFQLLGKLRNPAIANTLLAAAKAGSDAIHPIALEAYMQIAYEHLEKGKKRVALRMFTEALRIARTKELRGVALRGLAAIASPESLPIVERLLKDEAVRHDALRAYIAIAKVIADAGAKERGIEMLRRAIALNPPRDATESAVTKLRELGVAIDPARERGFVTCWWVIGPFSGTDIDRELPPERAVDLNGVITVGNRKFRWIKHRTADIDGFVNLHALLKPNTNVTAYLYTEVTVERAQDALFRIGSDDSIKCWLNGKLIHRYPQARSAAVDQDIVKVHLSAGVNTILLKVVNFGGGWCACLRITDLQGTPLKFHQRE